MLLFRSKYFSAENLSILSRAGYGLQSHLDSHLQNPVPQDHNHSGSCRCAFQLALLFAVRWPVVDFSFSASVVNLDILQEQSRQPSIAFGRLIDGWEHEWCVFALFCCGHLFLS